MKRYQIHCQGPFWSKPWVIMVKVTDFWQQISPNYLYEKSARNWAERNNIKLEN